jgi:hypothetical protein
MYGNGIASGNIIFLTNDGNVHSLSFDLSANKKIVLKQDVSQYTNIVSVVKNSSFG